MEEKNGQPNMPVTHSNIYKIMYVFYKVMFCRKEMSTPAATAEPITPDTLEDMQ